MHPIALAHSQISATRSLRSSVRNSSANVIYETNWQSAHFARLISIHCGHSFLRHVLCTGQRCTNFMDKGGHKLSAEAQTEGRQEHSTATAYSGNWETSPNPGAVNGTFRKPNWRYLTNKRISKVYM